MVEKKIFLAWFKNLSRPSKTGVVTGGLLLAYTILGFLIVPLVLKGVLEKKLPQRLQRQVTIEKIRLNPYSLSAAVEGFTLARKEGNVQLLSFDRLFVNLQILSIFKKALIVKSISLDGPVVEFDFLGDQLYSFSDLLESGSAEDGGEKDPGAALFSINNIEISGGSIIYRDLPKERVHQVADLNLSIPSVSSLPSNIETYVQPAFSAVINGTATSLGGQTKPFHDSLATEVDIKMQGINIPEYLAYVPNPTGLTFRSALMDINARLTYLSDINNSARLSMTGTVTMRDINVVDRGGQSYFELPSITVEMGDSNLLAKEVRFVEIKIDSPHLEMVRIANGDILPLAFLKSAEDIDENKPLETKTDQETDQGSVALTIDSFILDNGEVLFSDRALKTPAELKISGISFKASSLSNVSGAESGEISYAMLINDSGKISGDGRLALEPLALKSSLGINAIELKGFQPYISEQIRILVGDGSVSVQGDIEVKADQASTPAVYFSGMSYVSDLAISDTVVGDDLLQWQNLHLKKISFSSRPPELLIDEVGLEDLYAKILINDDGTINLATLAADEPETERESVTVPDGEEELPVATEGATRTIVINRVWFKNGKVQFMDKNINPAYGARLSELNGSITGLSSQKESRAALKFDGKIDQQASLAISGTINPLSNEPYADIKIDFTDFNLSPLTPYTGKYAGYKTDKGKLNLDLQYLIEGKKLESTNKVFLDQFTLGAGVESPDATSLPVNLAISLLKNRQGEIHLDIPVRGDLDDPEFSIGGVVLEVIVNLIAKAATSPFALLGSLIPEGEDLQHIIFEPGSDELTKEAEEKMKLLAKVLYERPGLKMDMTGRFDQELDRKALAKKQMEKLIKLEKLKKSGSGKDHNIDYRTVSLQPEEYSGYLDKVYRKALKAATDEVREAAKQLKPANDAEKVAHKEKIILAGIRIEDEDLRLLAIDRANSVLQYLVEDGQVEPGRLFMVEPQAAAAEEGGVHKTSKMIVELSIK